MPNAVAVTIRWVAGVAPGLAYSCDLGILMCKMIRDEIPRQAGYLNWMPEGLSSNRSDKHCGEVDKGGQQARHEHHVGS